MVANDRCEVKIASGLEKVFADGTGPQTAFVGGTVLQEDTVSFQVAIQLLENDNVDAFVEIDSPLAGWTTVRQVRYSPSSYPCHAQRDAHYQRTAPGLFPDRLEALPGGKLRLVSGQWRCLWADVETDANTPGGKFPVRVSGRDAQNQMLFCAEAEVEVVPVALQPGTVLHTEWFHYDCLADYYGVPVFSAEHWRIVENFVQTAVKRGMNTLYTPLFTPPLDTAVGTYRPTVQLVGVQLENGRYYFDFAMFDNFVAMCDRLGVRMLEFSHLFTQWGAACTPKIMVTENGESKMRFGWHTRADTEDYGIFLDAFLPALKEKIQQFSLEKRCLFHVSDEPGLEHMESYVKAKQTLQKHLAGFPIVDALSDYAFYQTGAVDEPITAIDHIEPFLEGKAQNLWAYYCTGQAVDVSNRFFGMALSRCRMIGVQMYKYGIKGFLHWGYNFYNTQLSLEKIDPYRVTDAGEAFPSGDPFIVYPGKDGRPEESVRLMAMQQAFDDVRALQALQARIGRGKVLELIDGEAGHPVSFSVYPQEDDFLLNLRNKVNRLLGDT